MDARKRWTLVAAGGFAYLVLACSMNRREDVPVHGWWSERGPVVPHDTFPSDCTLCHVRGSWTELREDFVFDHEAETGVALEGAHRDAECLRCHNDRGPVAVFAARGCAGCHEDVHLARLGQNCEDCHGQDDWRPPEAIARHDRTRFPLVGAHAAAACWRCHPGADVGRFTGADPDCRNCHGADLARATDPDHVAQGWVTDCDRCHIPTTWTGAGFNHAFFPLTGRHGQIDCAACHEGDQFAGLPTQCYGCHETEYLSAPDHLAQSYPTDCERCHGTWTWQDARFDHGWITQDCVDCHLADYQNADDPDHVALDVPTDCTLCHGTKQWQGAGFDHGWITQDCVDCHLADYQATTDPDHELLGFPTDCQACHGTTTWFGADFDHDFPIDGGDHGNLTCAQCHVVPGDFMTFTCTQCHEHTKRDMDDEHDDVREYVYETMACYACHPDGQE